VVTDILLCKNPGENIVACSSICWTPNLFMIAAVCTCSMVIGGNLGCPWTKITQGGINLRQRIIGGLV
jgi:hypothetical protein